MYPAERTLSGCWEPMVSSSPVPDLSKEVCACRDSSGDSDKPREWVFEFLSIRSRTAKANGFPTQAKDTAMSAILFECPEILGKGLSADLYWGQERCLNTGQIRVITEPKNQLREVCHSICYILVFSLNQGFHLSLYPHPNIHFTKNLIFLTQKRLCPCSMLLLTSSLGWIQQPLGSCRTLIRGQDRHQGLKELLPPLCGGIHLLLLPPNTHSG